MPVRRPAVALAAVALAFVTLASSSAKAEMIAGWDFSQYFGSGFFTVDGATFVDTLPANYSDLDPTFNAGAESQAFGAMYLNGVFGSTNVPEGTGSEEIIPFTGSLTSNADAPAVNPFESFTILANEGQLFTSALSLRANTASSVVFEADLSSIAETRGGWSVSFGGKTLAGSSSVGIEFSTDGSSYQSFGFVTLLPSDAAYNVALGTATSEKAYVRFNFAPANATDLPIIDNVAIVVPEESATFSAVVALATLVFLRRRVSENQNPPAVSRG